MQKHVAIYARVSTDTQTVENQIRQLQEVGTRLNWEIVAIHKDEGISGAKGRDKRPGFDTLLKGIARKEFDLVAAWSVDRLGRSLSDLVSFLNEIQNRNVDLYLHQQGIDTSTPSGKMMFHMLGVFAEFERSMIRSRVMSGQARARADGKHLGRPPMPKAKIEKIEKTLGMGKGIRETARQTGASTATVMRIKRSMMGPVALGTTLARSQET